MIRYVALAFALTAALALSGFAQQDDSQGKAFDVRSSVGDMHVGKDADAQKQGLPLYPGARPKHEKDNDPAQLRNRDRELWHETGGRKIRVG